MDVIDWVIIGNFIGVAVVAVIKFALYMVAALIASVVVGLGLSMGWKEGQRP